VFKDHGIPNHKSHIYLLSRKSCSRTEPRPMPRVTFYNMLFLSICGDRFLNSLLPPSLRTTSLLLFAVLIQYIHSYSLRSSPDESKPFNSLLDATGYTEFSVNRGPSNLQRSQTFRLIWFSQNSVLSVAPNEAWPFGCPHPLVAVNNDIL
jgi:hypothetical protein